MLKHDMIMNFTFKIFANLQKYVYLFDFLDILNLFHFGMFCAIYYIIKVNTL